MNQEPLFDRCGCCEPASPATPEIIFNRPRLSAIRYRVGTFATFREAMIQAIAGDPQLREWTVRVSDDYAIALLEMGAYLGDILTFYQERIANEAFLGTATLRESLVRLAALLGYRPAPGMAAASHLAFVVEKGKTAAIPVGLRVQSVPGSGEKPQKFETVEALDADARYNQVQALPYPAEDNPFAVGRDWGNLALPVALWIKSNLTPGDQFVIYSTADGSVSVEDKEVVRLEEVPNLTVLHWKPGNHASGRTVANTGAWKYRRKFRLFGHNAPDSYLFSYVEGGELRWTRIVAGTPFVDGDTTVDYGFEIAGGDTLQLDAAYADLKVGTRVLIPVAGSPCQPTQITAVSQVAAQKGILNATVTQITLQDPFPSIPDLRAIEVYELADPEIILWDRTYPGQLSGDTVYVPLGQLDAIEPKRKVMLDDKDAQPQVVSVVMAYPVSVDGDAQAEHLQITFTPSLSRALDSGSAVLYGNVAQATHGETVKREVLGDGDASAAFQRFKLLKSPVTFVPQANAPNGAANTLQVQVGGVKWVELLTLFGSDGDDEIYTTRFDDQGLMIVQFGDGKTGARMPTGRGNVTATYRQGLGEAGNVNARTLTTLLDKPVGLRSTSNPGPAKGGAEPESPAQVRLNAPNTVRTFGRIVSLRDFEDAAREYAGIAKARATWEWRRGEMAVRLVVAGDKGAVVGEEGLQALRRYLDARRDANRGLVLGEYVPVDVVLAALLRVDARYDPEEVEAAALAALQNHFAFDQRDLGQSVHLSGVYAVLQGVAGVISADVNQLLFKDVALMPEEELRQRGVRLVGGTLVPEPLQGHLLLLPYELARLESPETDVILDTTVLSEET